AGVAHHLPGELAAGYVGQGAGPAAAAERGVPRPDPGGQDLHQHLAVTRLRNGGLADLEHLWAAELAHHDRLHRHSCPVKRGLPALATRPALRPHPSPSTRAPPGTGPRGPPPPPRRRVGALSAVPP